MLDYRYKKIGNSFLITTNHGSWIFLNKKDFEKLKKERIKKNSRLYSVLEDKGIIITKNNKKKIIEQIRKKYDFLLQGTALHIIIPTLRCNHKCIYCHASSKPCNVKGQDMDKKTAKKTVDFIFQSPSNFITIEFQGGEPLLNWNIVKYIIEYAKKLNKIHEKDLLFSMVSNLTLMDKDKMDYLIKNNVGICTSLDGPEKLHNQNRPFILKNKSFFYVKKWAKIIQEEYRERKIENRKIGALITVTKQSLPYYKKIVDEYLKLGFRDIYLRFLNNLGDARPKWNEISYSSEEFIDFWKKSLDYIIQLNKKGKKIREWFTFIILKKIIMQNEPNHFELRSPCGAVIGQMAYNYNGDIYSCDEARMVGEDIFKLGNVKNNKYNNITTCEKACALINSSITEQYICDACAYKPYCGICPVCNYVEQGSIVAAISKTARCDIYKSQFDYIFNKLKDKSTEKIFKGWIEKFDLS